MEDFITNNFDNEKRKRYTKWFARAMYILFIRRSFEFAYHEIGHGLRGNAYGKDFQLCTNCKKNVKFKKDQNFFKFFAKNLFNFSRACCRFDFPIYLKDGEIICEGLKDDEDLIVDAGGMNN